MLGHDTTKESQEQGTTSPYRAWLRPVLGRIVKFDRIPNTEYIRILKMHRILNTEYIRFLKNDRIRIPNSAIRTQLFE